MDDNQVQGVLKRLYRIAEAGEKGYATAAVNMPDPAVKLLMKSFACQRMRIKQELFDALQQYGAKAQPGRSIPGIIHRGRVAIFAGMAIEKERQERVVLREASTGERAALHEYDRALSYDLPEALRAKLEGQKESVRRAAEQIELLRGKDGQRMVLGSFPNERRAAQAAQDLRAAGFSAESIHTTPLAEGDLAHERGATVFETTASGIFGGALWGGLTGILVGFGAAQATHPTGAAAGQLILVWGLAWLAFLMIGAIIGGVLALFIGSSISEGDRFEAQDAFQRGSLLVSVTTDEQHAQQASRILEPAEPPENSAKHKPATSRN